MNEHANDCCEIDNLREVKMYGRAVVVGLATLLVQTIILRLSNSNALLSDTIHLASDNIVIFGSFFVAVFATMLSDKKEEMLRRYFAYFGIALLAAGAYHVHEEAIRRMIAPVYVANGWVLAGAIAGGAGNVWVFRILHAAPEGERNHTFSILNWHVIFDLLLSVVVGISAGVSILFGVNGIDTIISSKIALYMFALSGFLFHKVKATGSTCHTH